MEEPALDFGGFNDGFEFDVSDDEREAPVQAPWDFSGALFNPLVPFRSSMPRVFSPPLAAPC
jgi:hypothetical protein